MVSGGAKVCLVGMFLPGRNNGVNWILNQLWPSCTHCAASYLRLKVTCALSTRPESSLRLFLVGNWCDSARPDKPDKHEGGQPRWKTSVYFFQSSIWGHWNSKTLFCTCLSLSWCPLAIRWSSGGHRMDGNSNLNGQDCSQQEGTAQVEAQKWPILGKAVKAFFFLPPYIILGSEHPRFEWF